jgi:catechol 2,3-dioxygenase-like lactoylglutathione lyase family enzyme
MFSYQDLKIGSLCYEIDPILPRTDDPGRFRHRRHLHPAFSFCPEIRERLVRAPSLARGPVRVNLAILDSLHETVPEFARDGGRAKGLLLNFEVDDVDAEYKLATEAALPIVLELRDEAFGQRHFITRDPNGVLIDIIKPIPPSPEFLAQFADDAAAT